MKRLSGLIFIIMMFAAFSLNSFAQNDQMQQQRTPQQQGDEEQYKQTATELTQSLSQHISLTPEQSEEINNALVEYQKDFVESSPADEMGQDQAKIDELNNSLKEEITNILDDNQITAFNNIESQWFQEVQTKVQTATARQETQDRQY